MLSHLLVTEQELLASRNWTTIVLDEAHTIKNCDTQTSQGAAVFLEGGRRKRDGYGLPATPEMNYIGILASTDPVALDNACLDLVFNYNTTAGDNAVSLRLFFLAAVCHNI